MAVPARVTELINTIAADNALRDRLTNAADDAARAEILASLGFSDVSTAEVRTHAHAFLPPAVEEVDDAQLAEVAGGGGDTITTLTTTTTVTVGASAAAAT